MYSLLRQLQLHRSLADRTPAPPHRLRIPAWCAAAIALAVVTPSTSSHAQACVAGTLASYVNPNGPGGCSIGNVALSWGQFGGISGNYWNVNVTPLSGTNAKGTFFGFRLTSANAGPMVSATINTADAQVANPNYDPNDPSQGPEFLPYLQPTQRSDALFWRFTHSLLAANAITRLELRTVGTRAPSSSQPVIDPTYLQTGEPDVSTGCGWSIYDPNTSTQYDAANKCAFFNASSNNFLWREISDNTYAQTVWGSTGQYNYPDQTTNYCQENGASVYQLGSDCTSFQDLNGTNWGSLFALGFNQTTYAMRPFGPPDELGLFDPSLSGSLGASASVDEAEFRIYYQTGVVPEPGTWALMAAGLVGVFVAGRRRHRTRA